jgi:hypothetical protein
MLIVVLEKSRSCSNNIKSCIQNCSSCMLGKRICSTCGGIASLLGNCEHSIFCSISMLVQEGDNFIKKYVIME